MARFPKPKAAGRRGFALMPGTWEYDLAIELLEEVDPTWFCTACKAITSIEAEDCHNCGRPRAKFGEPKR